MRRPLIGLVAALLAVGVVAGGLAWLLDTPHPPPGAGRGERLYYAYCVTCHGVDGRGSWRAALFLLRPGDLTNVRAAGRTERYLFDIIKHGGDPFGRPGMPAFRFLSDADIEALVRHVRVLASGVAAQSRVGVLPERGGTSDRAHLIILLLTGRLERSGHLPDAEEDQPVTPGPHGQPYPVAWPERRRVELGGLRVHGHHLHRRHAQGGRRPMTDQQQVRSRARHHLAVDLERRRPHDRAPEDGGQHRQQAGEEPGQQESGPG